MKSKFLLLIYSILMYGLCYAQEAVKPLNVGDKVPEILIEHLLNYSSNKLRLADLRGKLLILDFWGVHCSSCIKEMPEMQSYQQEFKDQIQVLLVTTDSKKDIQLLQKNSQYFSKIKLPIVYEDTQLVKLFPYNAYGLHVWIDKDGIVRYKTDSRSYTANDISNFIDGSKISLTERGDTTQFNKDVPIWMEGNGRQLKHLQYYSCIAGNLSNYAGAYANLLFDSATDQITGARFINYTVINILLEAYREWGKVSFDSIQLKLTDSTKYFPPAEGDRYKWFLTNTSSYELRLPPYKAKDLFSIMRQDIERYYHLTGSVRVVDSSVLILSMADTSKFYKNHSGACEKCRTILFQKLLDTLSHILKIRVVKNSTFNFPNEINMPNLTSIEDVNLYLEGSGFKLVKKTKPITVLSITDSL